ncbi:hypothetical protein [Hymenobacter sp. GOD-10R]|uniref:hypothetical protein n=1 Tax=Hymenobacter sp. GOD-10R TaxID=3093922 RepID=UPI002D77C18C|nr:hypothetical protein [Hymenobacter sp. GOD-10R]WRQ30176.1 hypothetical protein SD425_07865 [Hymenobacter sp. GOD-10R]
MIKFAFRVQRCFPESLAQSWGEMITQFHLDTPQARILEIQHQTTAIGKSLHPEIMLSLLIKYEE